MTDLADLEAAIQANLSVLTDIQFRALAMKRQADECLVTEPALGGELYRLAKAVRTGTAAMLDRLDLGVRSRADATPTASPPSSRDQQPDAGRRGRVP